MQTYKMEKKKSKQKQKTDFINLLLQLVRFVMLRLVKTYVNSQNILLIKWVGTKFEIQSDERPYET